MNVNKSFLFLMISGGLLLCSCRAGKETSSFRNSEIPVIPVKPIIKGGEEAQAVLNATVFRMNGNYADNVAITLNQDGELAYYPDPSDISEYSSSLPLGNGWYLNRQGISPDSKFTIYTFEEYRNLKQLPSHQKLLESIIPGAVVTEFVELPVTASEAMANPDICIQYLSGE